MGIGKGREKNVAIRGGADTMANQMVQEARELKDFSPADRQIDGSSFGEVLRYGRAAPVRLKKMIRTKREGRSTFVLLT